MQSYFDNFILIFFFYHTYITNSFFILSIIIFIFYIILIKIKIIPSILQNIIELIIEHWLTNINENYIKNKNFLLPILSLFFFILLINFFGIIIYSFPITTHLTITFFLSFSIWLSVIFLGFYNFKIDFLSNFMPNGAPLILSFFLVLIEIISNITRPIALGLRLAANLTAGHILLTILTDFGVKLLFITSAYYIIFPILILLFITLLEIGVLIIQAYVFVLLTNIYINDSLNLH